MWLGPPCMKMKMTRFARGLKCGGLGASGFAGALWAARPARARYPNPQAAVFSASRRVMVCSVQISEIDRRKQRLEEGSPGLGCICFAGKKLHGDCFLAPGRRTPNG